MACIQPNRVLRTCVSRKTMSLLIVMLSLMMASNQMDSKSTSNRMVSVNTSAATQQTHTNARNCSEPAIYNFPYIPPYYRSSPLMTIVYVFVIVYMFVSIAIVCDTYFVPSLEVICNKLQLEPDIAGSTFMAAGSSAPELAAAVIGVFISKDDIGVGAVVGSAVFNIAFVISICALFAGTVVTLHWWPIVRDSTFYLISIIALFFAMYDEKVTLIESIMFLLIYAIYIVFMVYNKQIEVKIKEKCQNCLSGETDESSNLVTYKQINELEKPNESASSASEAELKADHYSQIDANSNKLTDNSFRFSSNRNEETETDETETDKMRLKVWRVFVYPIKLLCALTIPNCSQEDKQKWFIITFLFSCAWIAIFSYFLVWMITVIGFNLSISDSVMGLIFISAGVSIPDAITSLIVVRGGEGDMALTNAIGSNVFDILLCLGLPWFIKTAIVDPGSSVPVISRGLEYSTLSLISTVIFFLVVTHFNHWKLNHKYGIILMIWYFAFMIMASLYELNVFGQFNPPMCPTNY